MFVKTFVVGTFGKAQNLATCIYTLTWELKQSCVNWNCSSFLIKAQLQYCFEGRFNFFELDDFKELYRECKQHRSIENDTF